MLPEELPGYVNNVTLRFGPATTVGKAVGLKRSVSTAERAQSRLVLCSPTGKFVKQFYVDEDGNKFTQGECGRAKIVDGELVMVTPEDLDDIKKSKLPDNVISITAHPEAEVDGKIFAGADNAYLFVPGTKGKSGTEWKRTDEANEQWAMFLRTALQTPGYVFLGMMNFHSYEGLFRVSEWRGHILLQKQILPADMNDIDPVDTRTPSALRQKAAAIVESLSASFDPQLYEDAQRERIKALVGNTVLTQDKGKVRPTFDLMAALDAFDA